MVGDSNLFQCISRFVSGESVAPGGSIASPSATEGPAVWVGAGGVSWSTFIVALAPVFAGVWILGTIWLTGTLNLFSSGVYPLLLTLIWIVWFWPVVLHLVWEEPRAIRIAPQGVTFRYLGRALEVPWGLLTPDALRVGRLGLRVRYSRPDGQRARIPIMLTPVQASALLRSAYAPDWSSAGYAIEKLGVRGSGPT